MGIGNWLRAAGLLALGSTVIACSSSNSGGGEQQGVIVDDPVQGLTVTSPTQDSTTGRNGEFTYRAGEQLTFSLAGVQLGSPVSGKPFLVITELFGVDPSEGSFPNSVINLARLLQTLDDDDDVDNGIRIPAAVRSLTASEIDFSVSYQDFANEAGVGQMLAASGDSSLVSAVTARQALQRTIDQIEEDGEPNRLPEAVIDPPGGSINEGDTAQFSGAASVDEDGEIVAYSWTETSDVGLVLSNAATQRVTVRAPNVSEDKTATLQLRVRDDNGASDTISVDVLVQNGFISNVPPEARAGADQSVDEGDTVDLDGSGSFDDEDGSVSGYRWTEVTDLGVDFENELAAQTSFTAPQVDADTTATIRLTVTDTDGSTDSDDLDVVINDLVENMLPNAVASATPMTVNEGETVQLDGRNSTDEDGDVEQFLWENRSTASFDIANADKAQASFTAPQVDEDRSVTIRLTVTDNEGGQASDSVDVAIKNVPDNQNQVPVAEAGADQEAEKDQVVTLDGSASMDPDGDTLSYAWTQESGEPTVDLSGENTVSATFTAPSVNADTPLGFKLVVMDGNGGEASDTTVVTIKADPDAGDGPTAALEVSNDSPAPETEVTFDGSASDTNPSGGTLTYAWAETTETTCDLGVESETGSMVTVTAPSEIGTTCSVKLTVSDESGLSDSAEASFTVAPAEGQAYFSIEDCLESIAGQDPTACFALYDDCYSTDDDGVPSGPGETDPQECLTRAVGEVICLIPGQAGFGQECADLVGGGGGSYEPGTCSASSPDDVNADNLQACAAACQEGHEDCPLNQLPLP